MTPGVVAETDLAGTLKSEYVFFDGERVARRDGATGTGGVFYYFSDHLKTASVITDSAGVIKAESDYYPWGGELQFVNNDSNDYKFTGKKRDTETGLDYFGARYYSNGLGRFLTPDWGDKPVTIPYAELGDPQTLNLYGYVRGLPTVKADLDGHGWWGKLWNAARGTSCWCEGKDAEQDLAQGRMKRVQPAPQGQKNSDQNGQLAVFVGTIVAYNAADMAADPSGQAEELGAVTAYEVGTFEELSERAVVGDGLVADHIPSNASNIARAEEALGRPLNDAEKEAVRNQGTAVAVPDGLHKSASPTYGGRNTPAQIKADAANPQAAAKRDTQAMVKAASPANQAKAQAAASKISSGAGGDW
jgi:RHS repeat-associated protein